jgi:hypothetical protein
LKLVRLRDTTVRAANLREDGTEMTYDFCSEPKQPNEKTRNLFVVKRKARRFRKLFTCPSTEELKNACFGDAVSERRLRR